MEPSKHILFAKVNEELPSVVTSPAVAKPGVSRRRSSPWTPFFVIGVFGCGFLLFHLYLTTSFHHATMDQGLHRLEEELHTMMELQRAHSNATTAIPATYKPDVQELSHGEVDRIPGDIHRTRKRHWGIRPSSSKSDPAMVRRGSGATFTYFHPALGACGGHNGDNDFIVAISHLIWNNGAHCGDTISITYNGKSVQATVVDECMSCDPNHIDLSPGLLRHLVGAGRDMVTDGSWSFGALPKDEEKPKPKTTTSTARRPQTTSTKRISTTTRASSTSSLATSTSSLALPTASPESDVGVQNLKAFTEALLGLGGVALDSVFAEDT